MTYFLLLLIPFMMIWDNPSKHYWILSCGSVFTGIYMTWIYVVPISIPALLPYSIKSCSCLTIQYLIPYLIRNPTPRLPRIALSKFYPTHSYPLTSNSVLSFRCVSDTARMSGSSSSRNCIILYFLAIIPFTFTCIIFIFCLSLEMILGFVILKNSSSLDCLDSFLSSNPCYSLLCYYIYSYSASPLIHLLICLT